MALSMADILNWLKEAKIKEIVELVESIEKEFGVQAAAAAVVAVAGPAVEEQTTFDVILKEAGEKKINVIKEIRTITGLGLKEAKDLVDAGGKTVKEGVSKEEADKLKKQLEAAGAVVEVK